MDQKGHGCLVLLVLWPLILLSGIVGVGSFFLQADVVHAYPKLSVESIQMAGFVSLATTILLIFILLMQKWAFYVLVLLALIPDIFFDFHLSRLISDIL